MAAFGAIPDDSNDFQQNFIDGKTRNLNIKKRIWDWAFFPSLAFLLRSVNKLLLEVCWWFFWRWRFQTFLHATSSLALFVNFWEISQQICRKLSLFTEINSVFEKFWRKFVNVKSFVWFSSFCEFFRELKCRLKNLRISRNLRGTTVLSWEGKEIMIH